MSKCEHVMAEIGNQEKYQTESKRILGIDPGRANCGWLVVARNRSRKYVLMDTGCIVTASSTGESERLRVNGIYKQITELLHVHVPNCVAIERVFHNKNVSSSLTTAQTIGIIELAAAQGSLDVLMFTPQQVKSSVCGHGGVDKAAVQKFASRLTGVSIKNAHAADSVAVAIAGHLRIH